MVIVNMQLEEWTSLLGFKKTGWRSEDFPEGPNLSPYKWLVFICDMMSFLSLERCKLTGNHVEVQIHVAGKNITTERTIRR